jgi:hypothetical protein
LLKEKSAYMYRAVGMADQVKNCKICARKSFCRWHSPKKDAGWTEAAAALNAKGIGACVIPGPDSPIGITLTVLPEILGDSLDREKRINILAVKIVTALRENWPVLKKWGFDKEDIVEEILKLEL